MSNARPPRLPVTHLLVFDFETGGLDPWLGKAEPVELAAILLDKETLQEVSRFPARLMSVQHPENLNARALEVNKRTVEEIMAAESPWTVFPEFVQWVMSITQGAGKVMPVGHNVQFDINFMKWAFDQYCRPIGYEDLFDYHSLCTFQVAYFIKVMVRKEMKYTQLVDLTKLYGIPHAAHEAMGDVEATVEVLKRMYDEFSVREMIDKLQESHDATFGASS